MLCFAMIPDRLRQVRLALRVLLVAASVVLAGAAAAQQPVQTPLLLMISIDGLRPDYVTAADAHGAKIPNLRRFLKEGAFAQGVVGVIPTVTYPSHTTLITGVSPATHGIFANTTFDPLRENQGGWYWYSEDIRVATLWDAAARAGLSTASVQWPASVGARVTWNIPELWRAGTPDDAKLLRAVSTPGLLAELEPELGPYPRALTVESDEQRTRYAVRILEKKRPNLLTLHLIALDRVQHVTGPFTPRPWPPSSASTRSWARCAPPRRRWRRGAPTSPSCRTTASARPPCSSTCTPSSAGPGCSR